MHHQHSCRSVDALTPGRSRCEKMGEKGSKWLANLLYSRPPAFHNRYMGQPSRLCTASQPVRNQLYLSRELMSELSLVGTNTCGAGGSTKGNIRVCGNGVCAVCSP